MKVEIEIHEINNPNPYSAENYPNSGFFDCLGAIYLVNKSMNMATYISDKSSFINRSKIIATDEMKTELVSDSKVFVSEDFILKLAAISQGKVKELEL